MGLVSTQFNYALTATVVASVATAGCKEETQQKEPPPGAAPPVLSASGQSAVGEPLSTQPVKQGATARARSYTMVVRQVKTCATKSYTKPRAGFEKVGVLVEITALSDQRVPANSFYARIVSRGGKEYRATFGGCTPDLRHTPLAKGESTSGWMTFEIPERTTGLRLKYAPFLRGSKTEPLEFILDR